MRFKRFIPADENVHWFLCRINMADVEDVASVVGVARCRYVKSPGGILGILELVGLSCLFCQQWGNTINNS